ncbi:MAG: hypothetical protein IKK35_01625, partial [Rikenellaceae bacterium]|nr:hypothetical protein [Rikenellaceae bacterium]
MGQFLLFLSLREKSTAPRQIKNHATQTGSVVLHFGRLRRVQTYRLQLALLQSLGVLGYDQMVDNVLNIT